MSYKTQSLHFEKIYEDANSRYTRKIFIPCYIKLLMIIASSYWHNDCHISQLYMTLKVEGFLKEENVTLTNPSRLLLTYIQ